MLLTECPRTLDKLLSLAKLWLRSTMTSHMELHPNLLTFSPVKVLSLSLIIHLLLNYFSPSYKLYSLNYDLFQLQHYCNRASYHVRFFCNCKEWSLVYQQLAKFLKMYQSAGTGQPKLCVSPAWMVISMRRWTSGTYQIHTDPF